MKIKVAFNLFLVLALVSFCPKSSWAQGSQDAQPSSSATAPAASSDATPSTPAATDDAAPAATQGAAAQMVPAQAVLDKQLDSKTAQPGQQFHATLSSSIQLKNGPELPRGTVLVGTIATDSTHGSGASTLALRFTQANLKGGKSIPVVATIVGVAPPAIFEGGVSLGDVAPPEPWDGKTLQADVTGAVSGADLHSRIAGENSGVFVSTKNSDVKLAANSQFALAIAPQSAVGGGANGGS